MNKPLKKRHKLFSRQQNKAVPLIVVITLGMAQTPATAQGFLKKLQKGIEQVSKSIDKGAGTTGSETPKIKQPATPVQAATRPPQVIKPFTSARTKTIMLDKAATLDEFADGMAFVQCEKKIGYQTSRTWGVVDSTGNVVIDWSIDLSDYTTNEGPRYNSGVCVLGSRQYPKAASKTPGMLIIDKRGAIVKTLPNVSAWTQFKDSAAHVRLTLVDTKKSTALRKVYYYRFAWINPQGNYIWPHLTIDVHPEATRLYAHELAPLRLLKEGLRAYWSYKTGWGFIDAAGKITVQPAWRAVHDFSDGMAAVQNADQKWGFIDTTGRLIIDCIFSSEPTDFREGLAVVKKRDGSVCFIDKTGTVIDHVGQLELADVWCGGFVDGVAVVGLRAQGQYANVYLINRDLKTGIKLGNYTDDNVSAMQELQASKNGCYYLRSGAVLDGKTFRPLQQYSGYIYYNTTNLYRTLLLENFLAGFDLGSSENNRLKGYADRTGEVRILFKEPEF